MFIVLGEINLWTFEQDVVVKNTDYGAFRYYDKKQDDWYDEAKRLYAQQRGMLYIPQNKKGNKLKDSIKYLEDQLKSNATVHCQWFDENCLQIMLNTGLMIQTKVNSSTGDVEKLIFDKYLVGKVSEKISDVAITKDHLICTYNDNQITLVNFTKHKRHVFEKISRLEPKLSIIELTGPSGRRLDKKVQVNRTGDLVLIWWKTTMNEFYPWSPTVREHDRANVHLYRVSGSKLDMLCYLRTEFDPLCIMFDTNHENVIHSVEQKVSRKGEVTIEWRTYEVSQQDKLQRIAVISVPLPTHTSCVKFSPNQEMLLLCCIDGSITLYDQTKGSSSNIKTAFISTLATWHSNEVIFSVGNERGQFQHFDIAMQCVTNQILSEDSSPSNIVDLSSYFSRNQFALLQMEWNKKSETKSFCSRSEDALFLLLFERGPLGVLRVIEGNNFSADSIIQKYLANAQVDRATALLLAMNWDTQPRVCMHSLNQILNYLFKRPLTPERESLIQSALGSFHVPARPISQMVEEEYGDEVRDLTRRFFHHLLRYQLFEKAFRLAIDLNDHDLFMDIHFYALTLNDSEMASAAKEKAEQILTRSNSSNSSHSTCSRTSCSLCSDSISDKDESYSEESENENHKTDKNKFEFSTTRNRDKEFSQIPPLPVLPPHFSNGNGLMSTSFNDVDPFTKPENNLQTSAQDTQNFTPSLYTSPYLLNATAFQPSTASAFKPTLCKPSVNQSPNSKKLLPNFPDNIATSFSSLSVSDLKSSLSKSTNDTNPPLFSNIPPSLVTPSLYQDSLMSTSFNKLSNDPPISTSTYSSTNPFRFSTSKSNMNSMLLTSSVSNIPTVSSRVESSVPSLSVKSSSVANLPLSLSTTPYTLSSSKYTPSSFYDSPGNLMSTSFSNVDKEISEASEMSKTSYSSSLDNLLLSSNTQITDSSQSTETSPSFEMPPPLPSLNTASYVQNLPNKNYQLSKSTPGLLGIDDPFNYQISKRLPMRGLQREETISSILQEQHKNNELRNKGPLPIKTYRLNYDLNFVPFHSSYDSLNLPYSVNTPPTPQSSTQKHVKFGAPRTTVGSSSHGKDPTKIASNIPPLPVINVPTTSKAPTPETSTANEKPKVKFSDTVTHILVPGTGQSYRPLQKRPPPPSRNITDPRRELAESLPLCLGNEDYLKNFQPLSKETENINVEEPPKLEETAKIKVVHFGLL